VGVFGVFGCFLVFFLVGFWGVFLVLFLFHPRRAARSSDPAPPFSSVNTEVRLRRLFRLEPPFTLLISLFFP